MLEVKVLVRGGFGVVSSAQILGRVFLDLGFWATSIPRFGAERRGAPVHADVRVSSKKIRVKCFIEKGDLKTMFEYVKKNENALDRSLLRQLTLRRESN